MAAHGRAAATVSRTGQKQARGRGKRGRDRTATRRRLRAPIGAAAEDRVLCAVGGGSVASGGGAEPAGAGARAGARRGGEKRVRELPCYLAKLWGGELVEEKARGRREMATTREKEDTTTKRTTSRALGWCRFSPEMHECGGWWDSGGKDYFRDSQTRSLPMGSLYFCVELS